MNFVSDSLPDTFCGPRHLEGHGNAKMLVQEVPKQVQAEWEQAQVTAIGAVYDLDPVVVLGNHAQVDDPDVGQASGNHQTGQSARSRDVALVKAESSAYLLREAGLNSKPFRVPVASLLHQFHRRHAPPPHFTAAHDQQQCVGGRIAQQCVRVG